MATPLEALDLLKAGDFKVGPQWRKAHEICQGHEGERDYDWVHALCHAIEGDAANSGYWYGQAGRKRHSADVEAEWRHIREALTEHAAGRA
jgi:hypothetical protein